MSKIIFDKISFRNVMSYGNYDTVFEYAGYKNTLIVSKNGSGKSVLALDTLCYVLFNKPYRDIKLGQLVNSINNKAMVVTVWFSIGETRYMVKRGQKPAVFEIWKDDVLIKEDSNSRSYQAMLETILGFNFKTFKQIVVIGAANYVPFMQLEAKDRRTVIEDILDISIFSEMQTIASKAATEVKSSVTALEYEIQILQKQIQSTTHTISSMEQDVAALETERQLKIASVKAELDVLIQKESELVSSLDVLTAKPIEVDPLRIASKQISSKIGAAEQTISTSKKTLQFFTNHDECPQCMQVIGDDIKKRVTQEETDKIDSASTSKDTYATMLDQMEEKIGLMDRILFKINNVNSELSTQRYKISNTRSILSGLEHNATKVVGETALSELKQQLIDMNISLTTKINEKSELVEQGAYYALAINMLKDTGIKSRIIAQFIPVMNQTINEYLSIFDMFVDFELDETFTEKIRSRNRDTFTYNSFSEGEKSKIATAILMAWRKIAVMKNSVSTNLVIFDETLDASLDAESMGTAYDMVNSFEDGSHCIVITHRDVPHDMFDRVVSIKKVNDFSTIVENV